MNSTTANPASGALLSMGVSSRPDVRNAAAAKSAGQGDFQRLLQQAADKKAAAKQMVSKQQASKQLVSQQQQQQLESRQAERRLQEDKLQANKAQEKQRQASIDNNEGSGKASIEEPVSTPASAQAADHHQQPDSTVLFAEWAEQPSVIPLDTAGTQVMPTDGLPMSPEIPGSVSLEDIAQAVADMAGAALMAAAGGLAGREQAAGMAGVFRSAGAGFYSNSLSSSGAYLPSQSASAQALSGYAEQALAGNTADSMADKAATAVDLNLATMARQLSVAAAANTGAASGMAASPLAELSPEAGSARDPALSSSLSPLGQPVDGKPAPLTAGATPFNPSAAVKGGLGQPEWHNAIAERVAVMASKNLTSAEIQLDPPELGQLLVRVTLNQEEQASVTFSSQHAAVREALDQTAQRLREMFDAEGLNLVDVDVSDRSFQQGREQDVAAGQGGGAGGTEEESAAQPVLVRQGQGLIDQFV